MHVAGGRQLTYCTNIHPGDSLAEVRAALAGSLLESLDETVDASAEEAWSQEMTRRAKDELLQGIEEVALADRLLVASRREERRAGANQQTRSDQERECDRELADHERGARLRGVHAPGGISADPVPPRSTGADCR